jgi:predicted component of type VI protein secretion system
MIKVLLIVVQGKPEGKTIPIVGPVFKVGRSPACHLRPNSDLISREHVEIVLGDDSATIRDLGSRNGTMLNGRTLTGSSVLKSGDLIQIGPLTFAVAVQGATADGAAPATSSKPSGPRVGVGATSLDDVSNDEIDSWLIADNKRPTPDRPSGVYDGDTLTISAFKEGAGNAKAEPAHSQPPPAPPPPPAAAKPAAVVAVSAPAPAPAEAEEAAAAEDGFIYEQLPEGEGDPDEDTAERDTEGEAAAQAEEELIDESNPFYAAKKALNQAPAKPVYKDSSDAASDILRKMLDRRRASKST